MIIMQEIAVVPLVETGEMKEVGRGMPRGDGTFGSTADSGRIVIKDRETSESMKTSLGQKI